MLKKWLALLLSICLALGGAALAATNPTATPAPSATAPPYTDSDKAGIPNNPQRIVDLVGCSDVLFIMGLTVVGTTNCRSDDAAKLPAYLESALSGAQVLGRSNQTRYDLEAIRALEPDLILIGPQHAALREELKAIAPTVTIRLAMRSWKMDMLTLGELFTRRTAVATWLDNYSAKAQYIGENIRKVRGDKQRYLALMISAGQLYAFVDAGMGGLLYNDLGLSRPLGMSDRMGINMTTIGYDQLSRLTMDYLFIIGSNADLMELRRSENWMKLPVVQARHVRELPLEPYLGMAYSCLGVDALVNELAQLFNAKTLQPGETVPPSSAPTVAPQR